MSIPRMAGHSQGVRTLTARLMTELLTTHFTGKYSEPSVHAHQIVTAPSGMAWLRTIGDTASNCSLSLRTKLITITTMVEARLAEHGAPRLTPGCDDEYTRGLIAILDVPDTAPAHGQLLRDYLDRINKLLAPLALGETVLDHDQTVATFQQKVRIIVAKLRDEEYAPESSQAIILVRLGILIAKLQIDAGLDDDDIVALEEDLWRLLKPYHSQEEPMA